MSAQQPYEETHKGEAERSKYPRPCTRIVNLNVITSVLALALIFQAAIGAQESPWKGMIRISGREAQAVAVAVREFEKHQGTKTEKGEPVYGDLRHYDVELRRMGDVLEVGFGPRSGPRDIKEGAVGGRGQYGIETYYEVSLKTLKILRQTFAR
jgi:hypothetical protein